MQEVDLGFIAPAAVPDHRIRRFVLRLYGYYEFSMVAEGSAL
jgi:hypothetical protein